MTVTAAEAIDQAGADVPAETCQVYMPDPDWDAAGFHVFQCDRPRSEVTPWFMVPLAHQLAVRVEVCDRHAAEFARRYGKPPPPPPGSSPRIGPIAAEGDHV